MKRTKFSEAQIAFVLKQAEDGTSVGEVCRKAGISEATYYNWRKKYAGLRPSEMKRATPTRGGEREAQALGGGPQSGQGKADGKAAARPPESMMSGSWTSSMTIWRRDQSCVS